MDEKLSSTQIGKILNISHRSVLNHLQDMGVDRRILSRSHFAYNNKEYPKELENYDMLYDLYITQHKTKEQIGIQLNCAPHVIDRVLKNFNIHIRGVSDAKIGVQSGESHHNWKGGICDVDVLCREYFQTNISPKIRARDNYTCQLCGKHSNLHVHHIYHFADILSDIVKEHPEYNVKTNKEELYKIIVSDDRFNDEKNLITYCKECHLFKIHGYNKIIRSEVS